MYARLAIFEDLDLGIEEAAREWARKDGLRLSRQLPGYLGLMTFLDRENRRLVGIGLYDSLENLHKSDEIMNGPLPDSMPEEMKRTPRTFVGLFEVIEQDGVAVERPV